MRETSQAQIFSVDCCEFVVRNCDPGFEVPVAPRVQTPKPECVTAAWCAICSLCAITRSSLTLMSDIEHLPTASLDVSDYISSPVSSVSSVSGSLNSHHSSWDMMDQTPPASGVNGDGNNGSLPLPATKNSPPKPHFKHFYTNGMIDICVCDHIPASYTSPIHGNLSD